MNSGYPRFQHLPRRRFGSDDYPLSWSSFLFPTHPKRRRHFARDPRPMIFRGGALHDLLRPTRGRLRSVEFENAGIQNDLEEMFFEKWRTVNDFRRDFFEKRWTVNDFRGMFYEKR